MLLFAVAGLGLRYFEINFLLMFGHPKTASGGLEESEYLWIALQLVCKHYRVGSCPDGVREHGKIEVIDVVGCWRVFMWYVHFSLYLNLVACCVDWQCPQVGRWVLVST